MTDASYPYTGGTPWNAMRVQLPTQFLYCTYAIASGAPGSTPAPPAPFTVPGGPATTSWYYIVATCNMSGNPTNSTYFTSTFDTRYQSANEGN